MKNRNVPSEGTQRGQLLVLTVVMLGVAATVANLAYSQNTSTVPHSAYSMAVVSGYQVGGYQQPAYQTPGYLPPTYKVPGYQLPNYQTPSYQQPGYKTPGYQPVTIKPVTPGYVMPGYRPQTYPIPTKSIAGYKVPGAISCPASVSSNACSSGWMLCSATPLNQVPKSTVIKGSGPALYWYAKNGKRYVFPNEATYRTWYPLNSSCPVIRQVSDRDLATILIGGNVTYRPGTRIIKIKSDPKVYAVSKGGVARWLTTDAVIRAIFGTNWKTRVDDVPDAFFINYTIGTKITSERQYNPALEQSGDRTIDQDKGL
jgi:hypothetical protein